MRQRGQRIEGIQRTDALLRTIPRIARHPDKLRERRGLGIILEAYEPTAHLLYARHPQLLMRCGAFSPCTAGGIVLHDAFIDLLLPLVELCTLHAQSVALRTQGRSTVIAGIGFGLKFRAAGCALLTLLQAGRV